jgi:hypothetical protein
LATVVVRVGDPGDGLTRQLTELGEPLMNALPVPTIVEKLCRRDRMEDGDLRNGQRFDQADRGVAHGVMDQQQGRRRRFELFDRRDAVDHVVGDVFCIGV